MKGSITGVSITNMRYTPLIVQKLWPRLKYKYKGQVQGHNAVYRKGSTNGVSISNEVFTFKSSKDKTKVRAQGQRSY